MSDHDAHCIAWVFAAIASSLPEGGNRVAEVIDSADFIAGATLSRSELEHGVRDLTSARLIGAGGDPFAVTETGRKLYEQVVRDYEKAYARTGHVDGIQLAQEALGPIPCAVNSQGWSVSQQRWDEAIATARATAEKNVRDLRHGR